MINFIFLTANLWGLSGGLAELSVHHRKSAVCQADRLVLLTATRVLFRVRLYRSVQAVRPGAVASTLHQPGRERAH